MKKLILLAVVILSGCAMQPRTYEQQQMDYLQTQQTLQIMNSMQPRTMQPAQPMQQYNAPPSGLTWMLIEQAVSGVNRYCKYANGYVSTWHVTQQCPLSVIK